MENALLVGLSRQMALQRAAGCRRQQRGERQHHGFKADRSLFEEFLNPRRARRQLRRTRPPHQLRAGPRHLQGLLARARRAAPSNPLDVAIDGNAFLVVQTPAGERYTRNGGLQINNQGELVTADGLPGAGRQRPDHVQPTDHDITIAATATSPCSKAPIGSTRCAASCGWSPSRNAQNLRKEGSNLYSRRPSDAAAARPRLECGRAHRKIQRQFGGWR